MKKIIQFTLRVFIVSSLFSSLGIAAEEEKKKSDKKPKKTPVERFQWLDKDKAGGVTLEEIKVNPYWKKQPEAAAKMFKNRDKDADASNFIISYKENLARSLVIIITTIDPDAIVFGGGVSNEIDFLDELKSMSAKLLNEKSLKTVFLKPIYGDASGVRGAALLGRQNLI